MSWIKEKKKLIIVLSAVIIVSIIAIGGYLKPGNRHNSKTNKQDSYNNAVPGILQKESKTDSSAINKDGSVPDCCNVK